MYTYEIKYTMRSSSIFSPHIFKRMIIGGVLEFGPIFVFLASYDYFHIYKATTILMIATIISTILTYKIQKRLPYVALYVTFITIVFGYLTLMHRAPRFIQMRDTLYDLACGITLLAGLVANIPFLKIAFHEVIPMTDHGWRRLTYFWTGFFFLGAVANEYIRRMYSLDVWFGYKLAMVVITIVFGITVLQLCYRKEALPLEKAA